MTTSLRALAKNEFLEKHLQTAINQGSHSFVLKRLGKIPISEVRVAFQAKGFFVHFDDVDNDKIRVTVSKPKKA